MRLAHPGRVAAAALVVIATVLSTSAPALAGPDLRHARAQANALRDKVDLLLAQSEAAAEDYGAATSELEDIVTRLLLAEQGVDATHSALEDAVSRTDNAAAQLYMSGGPSAMYASVLDGHDISDVLDRMASVDSVVRGTILATGAARSSAASAQRLPASTSSCCRRRGGCW